MITVALLYTAYAHAQCDPRWIASPDQGPNGVIRSMVTFAHPLIGGTFIGGSFSGAGGRSASNIAVWDGLDWFPVGSGVNGRVSAMAVYDSGSSPSLYVGGDFTFAGGLPAGGIARFDGSLWRNDIPPLSDFACCSPAVTCMVVWDDSGGPALYVGGEFRRAGAIEVGHIARWNGFVWTALADGLNNEPLAMAVFDPGTGARLYVGGWFTSAGGVPGTAFIASWNGSTWEPLGSGVNGIVSAMAVYDDGDGEALWVGGNFTTAGGHPAPYLAKWTGHGWHEVPILPGDFGCCSPEITTLCVLDDGQGKALFIGGEFQTINGQPVRHIARWDGQVLSPLGVGLNDEPIAVLQLVEGGRPLVAVGGYFTAAGGQPAPRFARWGIPAGPVVTRQIGAVYRCWGDQVIVDARVSTGQSPAFRWRADGIPLSDGPTGTGSFITGSSTPRLVVTNASPLDAGAYDCRVSDSCGQTVTPPARVDIGDCYADCDCGSAPGVLDIFDFLCFGNRFAAGDPYACDCDVSTGPGVCDIFDFLCFGNAFSAGCP